MNDTNKNELPFPIIKTDDPVIALQIIEDMNKRLDPQLRGTELDVDEIKRITNQMMQESIRFHNDLNKPRLITPTAHAMIRDLRHY